MDYDKAKNEDNAYDEELKAQLGVIAPNCKWSFKKLPGVYVVNETNKPIRIVNFRIEIIEE